MSLGPLGRWRRRRLLARFAIDDADWQAIAAREPAIRRRPTGERARLRELATLVLAEKDFYGAGGHSVTPLQAAHIAAVAALLILGLDLRWFRGWRTIVVYPGGFVARRHYHDEAGVVHEGDEDLTGEAWEQGPVVLSWADVEAGAAEDGYNVVLHEFAHKLDMLDGAANGLPPLHAWMRVDAWSAAFGACFDDLNARLDEGRPVAVDPYAAEAPAECFAVLTEAFFETPRALRRAYPAVYEQLCGFYRQDPADY